MTPMTEDDLTRAVLERLEGSTDTRFTEVMRELVKHLHAFIRKVDLTPEEWMAGVGFLTATGQASDDRRQEFILLSDTLGVSMLVVMLDQLRAARGRAGGGLPATPATEATVLGPYYWEGAPELPRGTNIAEGVNGEPAFFSGRVTDTQGQPIAGAVLDIWSGDGEGVYDMQIEGAPMAARARIRTDDQGRYWFWSIKPSYYPVPGDGPVGRMLDRLNHHPNRPGHIHLKVYAEGHVPLTTQLFVANSPYIDSDVVFGVRPSLVVDFEGHEPGTAPDGRQMRQPYWSVHYDLRLQGAA